MKASDPLTALVRLPASLPSSLPEFSSSRVMEPIRMDVVELPCWDKASGQAQSVSSRWIRLRGQSCQMSSGSDTVTVKNLSNGYTATVFSAAGHSLTTDFIPLQPGTNQIAIRIEGSPGAIVENQFSFERD